MIDVRDSFLHFLADNLQTVTVNNIIVPIIVHNVRRDLNVPASDQLSLDAINVKFLNTDYGMNVSSQTVSIDLCYNDELQAASVQTALFNLLRQAAYTPKLDYTNPTDPAVIGYQVFWEPGIKFKPIHNMLYTHYHARLVLNTYQQDY
jgi:hypothetical protein